MDFDAIIIGSGPGGYAAAIRLGQRNKKVLMIEKDRIGGECLNYGCIPSKAFIELSHSVSYLKEMPGVRADISIDMGEWQKWKWGMIGRLTGGVETLCKAYGVRIEKGFATIVDRNTVEVNSNRYTCENLVIATGSVPVSFQNMKDVYFNREILDVDSIPERLAIIGGGYIGVELGTAFAKLGSNVTIIEMMDGILPGVDRELVKPVERKLRDLKVNIMVSTKVESVDRGEKYTIRVGNGQSLEADRVLLTVGRRPNTSGFGLEKLGLEMDHGFIRTDDRKMTSVPGVYAIGDVSGQPMLAHKAYYDAEIAADNICGIHSRVDYRAMPYVIYSDPEISYTGDLNGKMSSFPAAANGRSLTMNNTLGTFRIYCDERGNVNGAGIVAPHSSEMISELSLAVESGLNAMDIGLTIHPHPTVSEGVKEMAEAAYGLPLHFKPRS
ncbi:MAG: dihydrolipoyl dehydrogenase [Candidatus Thermoplasmatota archaeon]|nr:dihydrolipoyl dehydrogenase [Candidatus Thermoplasmatota archaeon]